MARKLSLVDGTDQAVLKITCPSLSVAESIAEALVGKRLAACVNIIPGVTSIYHWQGEICRDSEFLLLVKTTLGQGEGILAVLAELHPYEVPEAIWTKVAQGSGSYLDWITDSVGGG